MHDRPALRLLHGDGESIRGIARDRGASRNAVRRALVPGARDHYYRASVSEEAEPAVREVLADYPQMVVADIAVLIDWRHSRRTLSDLVAKLRPEIVDSWSDVEARPIDAIRAGVLSTSTIRCGTMTLGELKL
ncbi:hypothetical protein NG701_17090 [Pseudarthrobacter sp. HLT3-5]|uniref:hypothetical protein n=1 Tax=Pseudarthrobacter cellobiosi TaxID=2953654 RepID=UPI00208E5874|nr:hypothetical protein [Pseudarthrobacter sp. HLT3-5]MCO4276118.1 hypothetical protein [Pseudarthrobacter sp. HLT3-5]